MSESLEQLAAHEPSGPPATPDEIAYWQQIAPFSFTARSSPSMDCARRSEVKLRNPVFNFFNPQFRARRMQWQAFKNDWMNLRNHLNPELRHTMRRTR